MSVRAYYRNSTDKQAKARTVESQRAPVRALADSLGGGLVEYVDEGVSGAATIADRPALARLLADLVPGDTVIAYALDRLTRADNLRERYYVLGGIEDARARLVTVLDGPIALDDMGGRILLHVKGEASADERRKIRERTVDGKLRAIAEGRKPSGTTPFGLAWSKAAGWSVDEPAAAIVRDIYRRVLKGESTEQIARALEERTDARGRSVRWHKSRVWQTATSTAYRGEWIADKRRGLVVPVPAIVDSATWQEAQHVLGRRQRRGLDRTRHVYLLQGLATCDVCGAQLAVASANVSSAAYYVCARRLRPGRDEEPCVLPRRRVDALDALVWQETRARLDSPALLERVLAAVRSPMAATVDEVEQLRAKLRRLERDETALVERFASGALSASALDAGLGRLKRGRDEATAALAEAERGSEAAAEARARLEDVAGSIAALRLRAATATGAERREIVGRVVEEIAVGTDEVRLCLVSYASTSVEHETQTFRLAR